jgi:hypothetical protein
MLGLSIDARLNEKKNLTKGKVDHTWSKKLWGDMQQEI